jgi:hypothetical protein
LLGTRWTSYATLVRESGDLRMLKRALLLIAVLPIVTLSANAFAADASPWDCFNLDAKEIGATTFHYEKAFGPDITGIAADVTRYFAASERWKRTAEEIGQGGAIFSEIDKIVGPGGDDSAKLMRKKVFEALISQPLLTFGQPRHVYIVRLSAIKDYLRSGGTLPHFTYDKAADKATYRVTVEDFDGTFVLPIDDAARARAEVDKFVRDASPENTLGMAFYETVEMTILQRLKPKDPHLRWFYDGFALAIAQRLLVSHGGEEAAASFAVLHSTDQYKDLEKDVNLQYWLTTSFEVDTPLASEERLSSARYAFARVEADRLISAHGIECVRAILDKIPADGATNKDLFKAIREVTGEDVEARLVGYQRFDTLEKGSAMYFDQYAAAGRKQDAEAALASLLRLLEVTNDYNVEVYAKTAQMMFLMGHENMGYRVFAKQMEGLRQRGMADVYRGMEVGLIDYALRCKDSAPAEKAAEDVLAALPSYVPALVIRMRRYIRAKDSVALIETARKVVTLDTNPDSSNRRYAQYVLDEYEKWKKTQEPPAAVDSTAAAQAIESTGAASLESTGASALGIDSSAAVDSTAPVSAPAQ